MDLPNSAQRPPEELVAMVMNQVDREVDIPMMDECLSDNGYAAKDYGALLRMVEVHSPGAGRLYFVRPALQPYCSALYGAHLFRYFVFTDSPLPRADHYKLLFANGGDFFAVLDHVTSGLNDIETTGCDANTCWVGRFAFEGKAYQRTWCGKTTWANGNKEQTVRTKCW